MHVDHSDDPLQRLLNLAQEDSVAAEDPWERRVMLLERILPTFASEKARLATGSVRELLADRIQGLRLRGLYHDHWKALVQLIAAASKEGDLEPDGQLRALLDDLGAASPHIPLHLPESPVQVR